MLTRPHRQGFDSQVRSGKAGKQHIVFGILLAAFVLFAADSQSNMAFAEGGGADAGHSADAEHETGLPAKWKPDLVLFSVITFGLFLFVLKKVAWAPIVDGLDNREAKYRAMVEDAEADRDKALKLLADYEAKLKAAQAEVDEIIAEARRDAERTKTDILATAQKDAEATRDRALTDIDRATDLAIANLFDHVRANVVAATEKVLVRSMTADDQQRLVDEALAEVASA
jgi:F-type H+-transporting ATPase subunit b